MKTALTNSTAGIALAISLAGTAQAKDAGGDLAFAEASSPVVINPVAASEVDLVDVAAVSPELLAAFNAIEGDAPSLIVSEAVIRDDSSGGQVVVPLSISPSFGDINPFYGDINPFYGDIGAFWGDINPFYGDIVAFYGDINPFYGNISPFYGDIIAFWGDINPFYGDIVAFETHLNDLGVFWSKTGTIMSDTNAMWASLNFQETKGRGIIWSDTSQRDEVIKMLRELVATSQAQFGAVFEELNGGSFKRDFAREVLERHGIDLDDPNSLARLSAGQRSAFFLDWHDSLMAYAGIDHLDHWMAAVNWSPSITQIQGGGQDTVIGIVDGSFASDADLGNNIIWSGGSTYEIGGHGIGVASLIAAAHDGEGVMGIAPDVRIATYNPFDRTGSTSWTHVADGIAALQNANFGDHGRASIINLSLGESGTMLSSGLAGVFARPDIAQHRNSTVYVVAAGNDGVAQTTDVEWDFANDAAVIFVGSLGLQGLMSDFSNRPGDACLLNNGHCFAGNELFMRSVVAPGELLLVSDGIGGVTRQSGTSFAAPLVSGAIALLHDRWPWLAQHADASTEIIFRSARDLGAPGPDPIYGWGLLDVTASQSPLDFSAMKFHMYTGVGLLQNKVEMSGSELIGIGIPSYWETENVFFTAFERVGDTHRDFSIPVSSYTYGRSTNALGRGYERFQDYVSQRFLNWIASGGTDRDGDGRDGFTELRSSGQNHGGSWSLRYDAIQPRVSPKGEVRLVHGAATLINPSRRASFTLGHGQGAMALNGYRFGLMSDHDPLTGGVNPVLGLASGETFAQVGYDIFENTTLRVGFSESRNKWENFATSDTLQSYVLSELGDRPASALTVDIEQRFGNSVTLGAQFTKLDEDNAILGTQTTSDALIGKGARTEALTLSASLDLGSGLEIDLSATGARTETTRDQLFTNAGAVWSTAAQVSATKHGLFGDSDTLRVSFAQPLQIEDGALQFTSDQVIDRATGEIGEVTQTIGIETKRQLTAEAVYGLPLMGLSQFGIFGRLVTEGDNSEQVGAVVGGNFSLRF